MTKIGDIVRLKSGGPKMTVSVLHEDHVECAWFDKNGNRLSWTFPTDSLVFIVQPGHQEGSIKCICAPGTVWKNCPVHHGKPDRIESPTFQVELVQVDAAPDTFSQRLTDSLNRIKTKGYSDLRLLVIPGGLPTVAIVYLPVR
jgi:uncharacterized protein YodC (DUF2158 family)